MAIPSVPSRARERRRRPVAFHLAALSLVLLALVPVVGTGASFSADEGAAITQARSLSRGDGWIVEHPLLAADPAGAGYPLENSEAGARGVSPYAKHPLYAVVLAGADRVGGVTGMVLASLLATVAAAGLAGRVGRRLGPAIERPTVWAVGLASPLLFDGFVVMAHTLGAALAGAAVVLALRAVERRSVAAAVALAPVVAAGVLLRTEFVFLAGGLALSLAVIAVRASRSTPALAAGVVAGAVVLARLGEKAWTAQIIGPPLAVDGIASPALASGGALARLRGFRLTWLTAGYGGRPSTELVLSAMLALVLVAAYLVRRHPEARRAQVVVSGGTASAAALALALDPTNVVPGLLVAFPLVGAGLVLLRRSTLVTTTARICLGTSGLFALMVAATQYERGGSGEWGGRYFALGLSVVVPVLVLALADAGRRLAPEARRIAGASLAVVTLAMSAMAVGALRATHERNAGMNRAVARAALAAPPGDGGPAVVVAADGALARHSWPVFDDVRLLRAGPDLPTLVHSLDAAGISRFVLLTRDPAGPSDGLTVLAREGGGGDGRQWHVLVVTTR